MTHLSEPLRILVVDDCEDFVSSLCHLLRLWGHEARAATDGPEALVAAAVFQPEVVLLDLGLPRMDGYAVARRLREVPGLAGVRLAALTGFGADEDRARCRA